ncbi:hypothetical protein BX600DRAFT_444920 [Xylariales sp. PMI_506]|nr:hypothetical protein BX600DRAFT_444920 [Xylariales sp. PMI_506]
MMRVMIVGAGPAGFAAALALSNISTPESPIHITIFEIRPEVQTIGGSINLTPHALHLLDQMGVYKRLTKESIAIRGLDIIPAAAGVIAATVIVGKPFEGFGGGLRIVRHRFVELMLQTVLEDHSETISVRYDMQFTSIVENEGKVELHFANGEVVEGDVLLGCDGLHSAVRQLYVEPSRQKEYSGRAILFGIAEALEAGVSGLKLADGSELLRDTCLLQMSSGSLLISFYEPTRTKLFIANIIPLEEPEGDLRNGWKAVGEEFQAVAEMFSRQGWKEDQISGLTATLDKIHEYQFWPVYTLGAGGLWTHGSVLLLGEAAHSMLPQGQSTGVAIEDGAELAKVFEKRASKTIVQLFEEYEKRRRSPVNEDYESTVRWWDTVVMGSVIPGK